MDQTSLACKYRPKSFEECVGQPTIVSILSRQIATKTFKSAYLFAGPSGCGKTSVARIMAAEINGHEGEPIEIDAASNNGVDNIRAIINDARQTALDAEFKIYILDECHAFTNQAWQAALKLIEEPPTNTVFIFCTTNPDKIPETIMSRVQRFDFKLVNQCEIANRLEFILNEELCAKYERSALERIASMSNGFMREAISLLDKCISYGDVTLDNVEKVLGLVKYDYLFDLLNCIKLKDSAGAYNILSKIDADYSRLFDIFLEFILDCFKYAKTKDINITSIPHIYKDMINLEVDYNSLLDIVFKFRKYTYNNSKLLFEVMISELCRGGI